MSRYDEDLYENPFFVKLEKKSEALFAKATTSRWIICIPKFSLIETEKLSHSDFEDHILVPDPNHDGRYTTVSRHITSVVPKLLIWKNLMNGSVHNICINTNVTILDGHINLGTGFKDFKQVEILFEEVFYNNSDESYRVLCVGDFFNKITCVKDADDDEVIWAKAPGTYDECLRILWSKAGSNKTREHVDKALLAFCATYQKYEGDSITNLADLVSSQITGAMQIILKDQSIRRAVASNEKYMVNLKTAAEMYIMNATHKHLFSTITACVKTDDAIVNKMTRNLTEIRLHHLGVRKEFEENLPTARKELSSLNQFSTPLGRLLCLKRVMTALTKPLSKSRKGEGLVMTTDDFLPLLIYLIIKSQINNWTANLMYMKNFQQAVVAEGDIFSFYLTTTEAALDYIKSGEIKIDNSLSSPQKVPRPINSSDTPGLLRQASGGTSAKGKFFQYVQFGDEAAVTLMLKSPKKDNDDILSQLCHPLCSCEKCAEVVSKNKLNAREVSTLSRDDMGRTALHIAAFYGRAGLIDILVKNGALPDASDYLGGTPLHMACQKGYQNIILLLVHFGSDIGALDNEGNTPLHLCAKNGHEDCVKAILFLDILKSKLNVNAQNDMGDTPLHLAAKWGYEGIVKFLLETEADARLRNRKRQTPLSLAQNLAIKRMLQVACDEPPPIIVRHPIPQKSSISTIKGRSSHKTSKPTSSKTPPTFTSQHKPSKSLAPAPNTQTDASSPEIDKQNPMGFEVVDIRPAKPPIQLIDNSNSAMMSPKKPEVASLDKIDYRQVEKLFTAISNKDIELNARIDVPAVDTYDAGVCYLYSIVKFYLGWIDSPEVDDRGLQDGAESLCHPLCQCSKCQPIQKISSNTNLHVNCCNKKGFTPLHISVIENFMVAFRLFLRKGANVNMCTQRSITALHLACFHSNIEMVEILLECGADVNQMDQYGEIPLHLAAAKNNVQIVQLLLQHSSNLDLANIDGNTPLHRAAASNAVESVELLLNSGARPNCTNRNNLLPFNVTKSKDVQELLLQQHNETQRKMKAISEMQTQPSDNTKLDQRITKLQDMLQTLEGRDLQAWLNLGESIKTFHSSHSLKRSSTFDHSGPVLDTPELKLSLSIRNFDKEKTLKRRQTIDKSIQHLSLVKHSFSIQNFDSGTLKHVDPVDKSSPMHIYTLAQSPSGYNHYLDTPIEGKELDFTSCDEKVVETREVKDNSETSTEIHEERIVETVSDEPTESEQDFGTVGESSEASDIEIKSGSVNFTENKTIVNCDNVPDSEQNVKEVSESAAMLENGTIVNSDNVQDKVEVSERFAISENDPVSVPEVLVRVSNRGEGDQVTTHDKDADESDTRQGIAINNSGDSAVGNT